MWHDDGRTDSAIRADGAEQIGALMAIVAHHQWPRADRCPDGAVGSLLPHPGFILEPDLDRLARDGGRQCGLQQGGEVSLKACSASATFFG
jgi:hypothetical protein